MKCYFLYMALIIGFAMISFGCAVNYNTVRLETIGYTANASADSMDISCNSYPMLSARNNRYNAYLAKRDVTLLALKLKNNSTQPITLNDRNIAVMDGKNEAQKVDLPSVAATIHQPGILYMLWSILFINITRTNEDGTVSQSPPIPVGAVIGLGNTLTSYTADKKFHDQMTNNHLIGKTIQPNEEISGFVGIKGYFKNILSVKYIP